MLLPLPSNISPSRRTIIVEYIRLRSCDGDPSLSFAKKISIKLGYKLDVNGSNGFVLRVLRDYFDSLQQPNLTQR